ncbi:MAG TPA: hypothetical protein DCY88_18970 [Cyanobacteria bacterium UBA11372]|nr:hypothetical protein [Cyanobacteria bacterium UBA11372]
MDTNRFSNLQAAPGTNPRQEYQTEIAVNRQDSITEPNQALIYGGSFSLFAILTGTVIWLSKRRIGEKKESFFNFDRFNKVPCRNCRYFTGNFYLKCAVRPSEVLTKKAINCSDYWGYDQNDARGK